MTPSDQAISQNRMYRNIGLVLLRALIMAGVALWLGISTGCGVGLACLPCTIRNDPRATTDEAVARWAQARDDSDPCRLDAMQHCVAAALLANRCEPACAIWAGQINERLQRDGDPMDFHNNEQGADCEGESVSVAVACCEQRLDAGALGIEGTCQ